MKRFHASLYSVLKVGLLGGVLAIGLGAVEARASDDYDLFFHAKNAYDAGDYPEAVNRFSAALQSLSKRELIIDSHKLIAVSYLFLGDRDKAESHFRQLFTLDPDAKLDPVMFSPDIVDFFSETKLKYKEEIDAIKKALLEQERKEKQDQQAQFELRCESLKRNIYFERQLERKSRIVALLPFGAGQFQNGHRIKGWLFLGGEVLLGAAAAVSFLLHEQLRSSAEEPTASVATRDDYANREQIYRITNYISLGAMATVMLTGILDSLYHFRAMTVSWQRIPEDRVPPHLRHKKEKQDLSFVPSVGITSVGIAVAGRF